MKVPRFVQALAALVFLFAALPALPAASPSMSTPTAPSAISYSPDVSVSQPGTITISTGTYRGDFCVVFSAPATATKAGGASIAFDLKKPSTSPIYTLSKDGTSGTADQVLSGHFNNSNPINLGYAVVVNPGSLPLPGTYTASVTARLYKDSLLPATGSFVTSKTFTITINVATSLDVAIVAVNSPFSLGATSASLPFGDFAEGTSRSIDVIARSNVIHSIALSSAKGWKLANTDPLDLSLVAYSITRNGAPLSLTAGAAVSIVGGGAATPVSGTLCRLAFTILPYTELPTEGSYADTLTLTMSAP